METDASELSLKEERLRLEREALEIERGRLEAARARAAAEMQVERSRSRFHAVAAVLLLAALCFASGAIMGYSMSESRQRALREERLAQALSQISAITAGTEEEPPGGDTNSVKAVRAPSTAHGNVSVMVIQ